MTFLIRHWYSVATAGGVVTLLSITAALAQVSTTPLQNGNRAAAADPAGTAPTESPPAVNPTVDASPKLDSPRLTEEARPGKPQAIPDNAPNPASKQPPVQPTETRKATIPPEEDLQIKVFFLENAAASESREVLQEVFQDVKITADERTNTVIVASRNQEHLLAIEALVRQLDTSAPKRPTRLSLLLSRQDSDFLSSREFQIDRSSAKPTTPIADRKLAWVHPSSESRDVPFLKPGDLVDLALTIVEDLVVLDSDQTYQARRTPIVNGVEVAQIQYPHSKENDRHLALGILVSQEQIAAIRNATEADEGSLRNVTHVVQLKHTAAKPIAEILALEFPDFKFTTDPVQNRIAIRRQWRTRDPVQELLQVESAIRRLDVPSARPFRSFQIFQSTALTPEIKRSQERLKNIEAEAEVEAQRIRQYQPEDRANPKTRALIDEQQRKLEQMLTIAFELKLQLEKQQLEELHGRLKRLEEQLIQRQKLRQKIVSHRARELISGRTLQWSPEIAPSQPLNYDFTSEGASDGAIPRSSKTSPRGMPMPPAGSGTDELSPVMHAAGPSPEELPFDQSPKLSESNPSPVLPLSRVPTNPLLPAISKTQVQENQSTEQPTQGITIQVPVSPDDRLYLSANDPFARPPTSPPTKKEPPKENSSATPSVRLPPLLPPAKPDDGDSFNLSTTLIGTVTDDIVIEIYGSAAVLEGLAGSSEHAKLRQVFEGMKGVRATFREIGIHSAILIAIVRDPSGRCQRQASATGKESELKGTIEAALKEAGIDALHWEVNKIDKKIR